MSSIAVYRCWENETLLYVGMSNDPFARLQTHSRKAKWWPRITSATIDRYATRDEAANAERVAIRDEKPLFNVVGGPGHAYPRKRIRNAPLGPVATKLGSDDPLDLVFGTTGAARLCGLSDSVLAEAMRSGDLHGWQPKGFQWRVHGRCLNDWLNGAQCEHIRAREAVAA